jgi:hypothetical protein
MTNVRVETADERFMDPSSIALQGLQQADIQLEAAASRIASAGSASSDGANLDIVDLSAEMLALMAAQNLIDVNLARLKIVDQMQKSVVDLKGLTTLLKAFLSVLCAFFSANSAVQDSRRHGDSNLKPQRTRRLPRRSLRKSWTTSKRTEA